METPAPVQAEPKKSNTGLIIGIVVVILLCCCCLTLLVGGYMARSQFSNGLSGFGSYGATPDLGSGSSNGAAFGSGITTNLPGIPSGGRGDDSARTVAWGQVVIAATTDGCMTTNPDATATQIKVTQDPDGSGVWQEDWTIPCGDGSSKTYALTFTPGANDITDVKVNSGN
jgi:hypothetical protein